MSSAPSSSPAATGPAYASTLDTDVPEVMKGNAIPGFHWDDGPMKAAWISELGAASDIRVSEFPMPEAAPSELLVRVDAVAVDPVDVLVRSGRYATPVPFPFIVGRDIVGTVRSVGTDARGFVVGDRVWCNSLGHAGRQGAAAEFVSVPADRAYHLPAGVDAVRAAAVLHPLATAHLALFRHGGVAREDGVDTTAPAVVVAGAAGNVGSALVHLATAAGARVVATAAADDRAFVAELGADAVIDYRAADWLDQVVASAPEGAALAIDTSGSLGLEWAIRSLRPRGTVVVMAGFGRRFPFPVGPFYTHDLTVAGFAISTATVSELADAAATVNRTLAETEYAARSVTRIRLDDIPAAHERIEQGTAGSTRFVAVP